MLWVRSLGEGRISPRDRLWLWPPGEDGRRDCSGTLRLRFEHLDAFPQAVHIVAKFFYKSAVVVFVRRPQGGNINRHPGLGTHDVVRPDGGAIELRIHAINARDYAVDLLVNPIKLGICRRNGGLNCHLIGGKAVDLIAKATYQLHKCGFVCH
jgi:hypothetical protein